MAVQVWIGEKPEHPQERRAIIALANGLQHLEGLYLVLANFSVGGRNIDLVIIKQDAIFILELKHCDGRVLGSVNGPWFVEGRNGERKRLNPGRKNPYNQVISYFHALTNFLNEHRRDFLSEQKSRGIDFRTCKRAVVIGPAIEEGSEIELDWKVELKGLDELPTYLVTERSSEIDLSEEEMLAIPRLLYCTLWSEVNTVLAGTLIAPASAPAEAEAAAAPAEAISTNEAAPVAAASEAATRATPQLVQRARAALRTTSGRIAATASLFALILLTTLLLRPPSVAAPPPEAGLSSITAEPDSTNLTLPLAASDGGGCVWSGSQLVAKRWDRSRDGWESVVVDDPGELAPEIVVALEQVDYCGAAIKLTWSVRNNSDAAVEFPLRRDNIRISDGLGNEYVIADSESRPQAIQVAPGAHERGTAVASRSLSQNASSLLVRLKRKPFGEASFVVSLQP